MEMGVERVEANPKTIIGVVIVIPSIAVRDDAIDSDVLSEIGELRDREARFDRFQAYFTNGFLPSVEAIVESQAYR